MRFSTKCLQLLLIASCLIGSMSTVEAKSNKKHYAVSAKKQAYHHHARVKSEYRVNPDKVRHMRLNKSHSHASRQDAANSEMFDAFQGKESIGNLSIASTKALVMHQNTHEIIYSKNLETPTPIASVTKLMTAMVVLDAHLNLQDEVEISPLDVDYLKGTSSRLAVGTAMTREDLLNLALIASENRAASALATTYPGGKTRFIQDMNAKAASLGMVNTHFEDSTGLNSNNVSTALDLAKMVHAAYQYPLIRQITTSAEYQLHPLNKRQPIQFHNTNALVRNTDQGQWDIGLSKTGYISEAGRCLVMQATIAGEPLIMVLLDSVGKLTRIGDAKRIKKWVEHQRTTISSNEPKDEVYLTSYSLSKTLSNIEN